jgi:hypothetical protein
MNFANWHEILFSGAAGCAGMADATVGAGRRFEQFRMLKQKLY